MHATQAAAVEGIVPGGGVALLRAGAALKTLQNDATLPHDEQTGVAIVARALEEPMRWIAHNAGYEGAVVVSKTRKMRHDMGFNAQTERYENLVTSGVIDPTKVVRCALQNASSIAGLMLMTEAVVCDAPAKTPSSSHSE